MNFYITSQWYKTWAGGEVDLRISVSTADLNIVCMDYSMNGFMAAAQAAQVARRNCKGVFVSLTYPYLPYARQDRFTHEDGSFSLKLFANMINQQKFDKVTLYDPHSDVASALIERCDVVHQSSIFNVVYPVAPGSDLLYVAPDAGAAKKVQALVDNSDRIVLCFKTRNSVTGKPEIGGVHSPVDLLGRNCVIVDDICDGGRTFVEVSQALKRRGAKEVHLFVTHGIFSYGMEPIKGHIDSVHTTDSFDTPVDTAFVTRHKYFMEHDYAG